MKPLALVLLFAGLALACGQGEPGGGQTPPVSAKGTEQAAPAAPAPPAAPAAPAAPSAALAPESQRCLDLVAEARFQEAVPVCLTAASADPGNQQVRQALERARGEAAKLADVQGAAEGAAAGAVEAAKESAASQVDEAAKGVSEGIRY
jgi:hypothetical protein